MNYNTDTLVELQPLTSEAAESCREQPKTLLATAHSWRQTQHCLLETRIRQMSLAALRLLLWILLVSFPFYGFPTLPLWLHVSDRIQTLRQDWPLQLAGLSSSSSFDAIAWTVPLTLSSFAAVALLTFQSSLFKRSHTQKKVAIVHAMSPPLRSILHLTITLVATLLVALYVLSYLWTQEERDLVETLFVLGTRAGKMSLLCFSGSILLPAAKSAPLLIALGVPVDVAWHLHV